MIHYGVLSDFVLKHCLMGPMGAAQVIIARAAVYLGVRRGIDGGEDQPQVRSSAGVSGLLQATLGDVQDACGELFLYRVQFAEISAAAVRLEVAKSPSLASAPMHERSVPILPASSRFGVPNRFDSITSIGRGSALGMALKRPFSDEIATILGVDANSDEAL